MENCVRGSENGRYKTQASSSELLDAAGRNLEDQRISEILRASG
jgi:hypothetical protein